MVSLFFEPLLSDDFVSDDFVSDFDSAFVSVFVSDVSDFESELLEVELLDDEPDRLSVL